MKKTILCMALVIMLVLSMAIPAYATETWVLSPDTERITHGDDVYYRIDYPYSNYIDPELEWESYMLELPNEKMAATYADSYVYVTSGVEHIAIEAEIVENHESYSSYTYVEEAYYDEFMQIKNGEPSEYIVGGYEGNVIISNEELNTWRGSSEVIIEWDEIYDHDYFYLYATDSSGAFRYEIGQVLQGYFTDEIYLLMYEDYDESCFDELKDFDIYSQNSVTVYELTDTELEARFLDTGFSYETGETVVYGEVSSAVAGVFATIVFGIVPLAAMIFAIVMLIKVKDKKYRRGFVAIIAGTAIVLVAFVVVFVIAA